MSAKLGRQVVLASLLLAAGCGSDQDSTRSALSTDDLVSKATALEDQRSACEVSETDRPAPIWLAKFDRLEHFALVDDLVVVVDGSDIVALEVRDGRQAWIYRVGGESSGGVSIVPVDSDQVAVSAAYEFSVVLELEDGRLVERLDSASESVDFAPSTRAVVEYEGDVARLVYDGVTRWCVETGGDIFDVFYAYADDQRAVYGLPDGQIVALEL